MRRSGLVSAVLIVTAAVAWSCGRDDEPAATQAGPDGATLQSPEGGETEGGDAGVVELCSADAAPGTFAPAWVSDESLWEPVVGLETCGVHRARLPSPKLPKRTFCSCGEGCRVTAGNLDGSGGVSVGRGWYDATTTYLHVDSSFGLFDLREVLDITHNTTITSVETRKARNGSAAQCSSSVAREPLGPSLVESWSYDDSADPLVGGGAATLFYARARYRETSALEPLQPWVEPPQFDEGFIVTTGVVRGYLDKHSPNELHATADWDAGFPLPVVSAKDAQDGFEELTTWGTTFAWHTNAVDHGGLYVWSSEAGTRLVAQRTRRIMTASIGSNGLVWIEPGTQTVSDGGDSAAYSDMQLWWIPDVAAPAPTRVASGFGFPNGPGVVSGDGYAAFVSCSATRPGDCPLVVVKLSTGKVWTLAQPSGTTYWTGVFVVNERELVATEDANVGTTGEGYGRRLFVLETPKLDALVARFAAK